MLASMREHYLVAILTVAVIAAGCTNDTRGTGETFTGVCLGEPLPGGILALCGELFNDDGRAVCDMHGGCEWEDCDGACGFCSGSPLGCRSRDDSSSCAVEPGCRWFAPPECEGWEDCVVTWLHSGGCDELATNVPGTTAYIEYVDGEEVAVEFADYCP